MVYQIQNYLGEVVIERLTLEELETLKSESPASGFNYFESDDDLIERFANDPESVTNCRIISTVE